jgi:hypothetical protein
MALNSFFYRRIRTKHILVYSITGSIPFNIKMEGQPMLMITNITSGDLFWKSGNLMSVENLGGIQHELMIHTSGARKP